MDKDGIAEAAGAQIHIGQDEPHPEGIEKLVEIHVEQPECQGGEHHGGFLSIASTAVQQLFAKDKFLHHGSHDDGGK